MVYEHLSLLVNMSRGLSEHHYILYITLLEEDYLGKVAGLLSALPTFTIADTLVGIVTLGVLIYWPRRGNPPAAAFAGIAGGRCDDSRTLGAGFDGEHHRQPFQRPAGGRHPGSGDPPPSYPTWYCPGSCRAPTARRRHFPRQAMVHALVVLQTLAPRFPGCRYPPWRPFCCWSPGT